MLQPAYMIAATTESKSVSNDFHEDTATKTFPNLSKQSILDIDED